MTDMDSQHKEQTMRLERDIKSLGERFDRHLEIYAQNGKELASLKTEVRANHDSVVSSIRSLAEAISKNNDNHVSSTEFRPIKMLVYGFVTIVLVAVVGGIVALVVQRPTQQGLTAEQMRDILSTIEFPVVVQTEKPNLTNEQ